MQSAQFQLHAEIEQRHWWFVARRRIMRALIGQLLPPSPDTLVIDVGCGTGGNVASLADAYTCVGIDTSDEAIHFAQERFPKVQFLCGRAPADLGDLRGKARLLMLMDVLEHVPDDAALLADLVNWATPGTHFLLTVPADPSLWSAHDESFGHHRRYDLDRFRQAWAGLPVTTLLVSYFNTRLYPLVKLARTISRWRGHAAGEAGTDFRLPAAPANRMFEQIFAGEAQTLLRVLNGRRAVGYRRGVSLVAILRRQ